MAQFWRRKLFDAETDSGEYRTKIMLGWADGEKDRRWLVQGTMFYTRYDQHGLPVFVVEFGAFPPGTPDEEIKSTVIAEMRKKWRALGDEILGRETGP